MYRKWIYVKKYSKRNRNCNFPTGNKHTTFKTLVWLGMSPCSINLVLGLKTRMGHSLALLDTCLLHQHRYYKLSITGYLFLNHRDLLAHMIEASRGGSKFQDSWIRAVPFLLSVLICAGFAPSIPGYKRALSSRAIVGKWSQYFTVGLMRCFTFPYDVASAALLHKGVVFVKGLLKVGSAEAPNSWCWAVSKG